MANKARKLTALFVENAKDGEWPDVAIVGLVLCVTNAGQGKSWEYRYTSPVKFKVKDGKRKYKRRSKGLGSAKAAVGGVSLVEAREKAALYSRQYVTAPIRLMQTGPRSSNGRQEPARR
jgi:hypothetical protein